jgi:hypothetical protein
LIVMDHRQDRTRARALSASDSRVTGDPMPGGNSSAVERQPSKLGVAGSNPVSRSSRTDAHVAQSVEHVLGKDGVTGSSPVMGSTLPVSVER